MSNGAILTRAGWNALVDRAFKTSSVYSVPSRFKIGIGTTTPTQADSDLASTIYFDTPTNTILYQNFVNGYPTFDTTNQKVTTQGFVASTQGNSNVLTEIGEFNTDGSPILFMRTVFTGITKTSAVQVFYTTTYKRI